MSANVRVRTRIHFCTWNYWFNCCSMLSHSEATRCEYIYVFADKRLKKRKKSCKTYFQVAPFLQKQNCWCMEWTKVSNNCNNKNNKKKRKRNCLSTCAFIHRYHEQVHMQIPIFCFIQNEKSMRKCASNLRKMCIKWNEQKEQETKLKSTMSIDHDPKKKESVFFYIASKLNDTRNIWCAYDLCTCF